MRSPPPADAAIGHRGKLACRSTCIYVSACVGLCVCARACMYFCVCARVCVTNHTLNNWRARCSQPLTPLALDLHPRPLRCNILCPRQPSLGPEPGCGPKILGPRPGPGARRLAIKTPYRNAIISADLGHAHLRKGRKKLSSRSARLLQRSATSPARGETSTTITPLTRPLVRPPALVNWCPPSPPSPP